MRLKALMITLLALSLAACFHFEQREYPNYWAPIFPDGHACPDLTGVYSKMDQGTPAVPLPVWMFPLANDPMNRIERVAIAGPANGLVEVRLLDDAGAQLTSRQLRENTDYECDTGWLSLQQPGFFAPLPAIFMVQQARLARSSDGALIVDKSQSSGGVAIIVPMGFKERSWHRYSMIEGGAR